MLEQLPEKTHCAFLDAATVAYALLTDGIHFDARFPIALGQAIGGKIADMRPQLAAQTQGASRISLVPASRPTPKRSIALPTKYLN